MTLTELKRFFARPEIQAKVKALTNDRRMLEREFNHILFRLLTL